MEFTNYRCPVCNEQFNKDDDIVVCPNCGAPHHRDCYDKLNHCFYEDKHSDDFSFENLNGNSQNNENVNNNEETVTCPNCKHENPKATFYCNKCGYPLNEQDRNNSANQNAQQPFNSQQTYNQNQNIPPFGFGGAGMPSAFDPMAGLKNDQPIAENVNAGEMAKFVGKNTFYFLRIFNNIKTFGNSKFNFSAFIFSGIYFLYRKMIGLGIIISFLYIALTVGEMFIQLLPEYQSLIDSVLNMQNSSQLFYSFSMSSQLSTNELLFLYSPFVFSALKGVLMIICGLTANRSYYKHCTKKINEIKNKNENTNINKALETSGGVNLPLAVCFAITYMIITYIPYFL